MSLTRLGGTPRMATGQWTVLVAAVACLAAGRASAACNRPRNVYLDLGANWCNTLRLYEDIVDPTKEILPAEDWQIFAFEASPLIAAYAEQFVQHLNGRREAPLLCVPPAGSSKHLHKYALAYGCSFPEAGILKSQQMRMCMFDKLHEPLEKLEPDPALNTTELLQSRLAMAARCEENDDRFVFVPAAAAAEDTWINMVNAPEQLIRGGSFVRSARKTTTKGMHLRHYWVRAVDVVTWFSTHFTEDDFVFLKCDIEGAEYAILEKLIDLDLGRRIDLLSIELHDTRQQRASVDGRLLISRLKEQAPDLRIVGEGLHHGLDSHSIVPPIPELRRQARACNITDIPNDDLLLGSDQ